MYSFLITEMSAPESTKNMRGCESNSVSKETKFEKDKLNRSLATAG